MAFNIIPWIRPVITTILPYPFAKPDQDPQQPPIDDVSTYHTPFSSPNYFQPQPSPLIVPLDFHCYNSGMAAATKPIMSPTMQIPWKGNTLLHDHVSLPIDEPDAKFRKKVSKPHPAVQASISPPLPKGSSLPKFQSYQLVIINPILKNSQELQLGKTMLVSGMALAVLLLTFGEKVGPQLFPAILVLLCLGLACLWIGVLLRNTIPDKLASLVELFGAVCVLLVFFAVVGSFLPLGLAWFAAVCFVACLVPFVMSFSDAKTGVGTTEVDIC